MYTCHVARSHRADRNAPIERSVAQMHGELWLAWSFNNAWGLFTAGAGYPVMAPGDVSRGAKPSEPPRKPPLIRLGSVRSPRHESSDRPFRELRPRRSSFHILLSQIFDIHVRLLSSGVLKTQRFECCKVSPLQSFLEFSSNFVSVR